jgi:opacity protein-like surface antigen
VNGAGTDWTGTLNTSAFMSNVYYDFQNCNFHNIVPYVGTGIGVVIANGDFSTPAIDLSIKDEAFAYQFIAGASKKMSSSVDLFAEHRFLESSDLEIKKTSTLPAAKIGDYASKSNNVFFGLRWSH